MPKGERKTPIILTRNKEKKMKARSGSTPGSSKCETCKAYPIHRVLCSRNRSYKRHDYPEQMKALSRKV